MRLDLTRLERRDVPTGALLIYYGYPSLINGANGNVANAATQFQPYADVVLGAGLELTSHPDHASTAQIVASALVNGTRFFGYIPMHTSGGLTDAEIRARIDLWQATGVDGIFLDEYGYDYGVSRDRQNAAVGYAHTRGLPVIANGFRPEDAFGRQLNAVYNPTGAATQLNAGDGYLYESYQVINGAYVAAADWHAKATTLAAYRQALGFRVLSVTTPGAAYDATLLSYAYRSALIDGHDSFGWGETGYSGVSSVAPFRTRPAEQSGMPAVVVTGTVAADTVVIGPSGALGGPLTVTVNGSAVLTNLDASRPVEFRLGGANDTLTVQPGVFGRLDADGEGGDDTLAGGYAADVLRGGTGTDALAGGYGDDRYMLTPVGALTVTVTDTYGFDSLDFTSGPRGVTVDLAATTLQTITTALDRLALSGVVENFTGSAFADTVSATPLGVRRQIDGGPPTAAPGDSLVVDGLGLVGSIAADRVLVPGFADVVFANLESVRLTNTGVPRVVGVAVNGGATQRSRVTTLAVMFDRTVTFAGPVAAAFTVSRINGGAVGGVTASTATVGGVTVVTLSGFTGAETEFGSWADGRYSLGVRANQVSANGRLLDGDGNGVGGDDYVLTGSVANGLFRLYGDVNGDGSVSGGDFGAFRLAFGLTSADPGYVDYLDFDGSGSISGTDFGNFRLRFGTTVP